MIALEPVEDVLKYEEGIYKVTLTPVWHYGYDQWQWEWSVAEMDVLVPWKHLHAGRDTSSTKDEALRHAVDYIKGLHFTEEVSYWKKADE